MAHNHSHNNASKNILITLILNAFFVVVELIGGIMTNSVAILSDALHDFGDCLSLATAWVLQKKSQKGSDELYSYGYKRFSLLGSIFLSGILTISSILILFEAGKRLFDPQEVDAQGMFWLAIFGVFINGIAAIRMKKGSSLNERAIYIHIMEDVLGWVAVLVVSIVMHFYNMPILDPILSIVISFWVLSNVYKNIKDTFKVILQAVPASVNILELKEKIEALPHVESTHDIHVWSLDGESHVASLHVVSCQTDTSEIKQAIRNIAHTYNIEHVTIEIEKDATYCSQQQ